jgi:hypothetical protein
MSYQTFTQVVPREETLYRTLGTLGEVEVGTNLPAARWPVGDKSALTNQQWLVILRRGKVVAVTDLVGNVRGTLVRGEELHVLAYSPFSYTMAQGQAEPRWSAMAVAADGSYRELAESCEVSLWDCGAAAFADDKFEHFGWKSRCHPGLEVKWQWNPQTGRYDCTQRGIGAGKAKP